MKNNGGCTEQSGTRAAAGGINIIRFRGAVRRRANNVLILLLAPLAAVLCRRLRTALFCVSTIIDILSPCSHIALNFDAPAF
jgi:hypothetical protein